MISEPAFTNATNVSIKRILVLTMNMQPAWQMNMCGKFYPLPNQRIVSFEQSAFVGDLTCYYIPNEGLRSKRRTPQVT